MDIFTAMQQRRSARAYLDKPVARAEIEEIFKYAGRAPSAINLQPWEYVVVYGQEKDRLVRRLLNDNAHPTLGGLEDSLGHGRCDACGCVPSGMVPRHRRLFDLHSHRHRFQRARDGDLARSACRLPGSQVASSK